MNALKSVLKDFAVYFNPKTRGGLIRFGAALLALLIAAVFALQGAPETEPVAEDGRGVRIARVGSFGESGALSLVGTVEAIDQATVQAEVGGRVTGVRVELGDRVSAGQIIATLENASQYAAVLQAEGSYEAALAAAAQSDISVNQAEVALTEARNSAVNVARAAYTAANSAVHNQIDTFFTTPDAQFTPGLRLEGYGYTSYLNNERVAFQTILPQWRNEVNTLNAEGNLRGALSDAEQRIERVIEMVDTFIILLNDQENGAYTASELASYSATFTSLRADLNAQLIAIENARTALTNAEEALDRARISGTGGSISAADASVKQALGTLRSAQAAYNKTILRSPIAGTVQSLSVKTGDYVGAMTTAATVANQDALLITTFVNADERERIAVGGAVTIEDGAAGTVTAIAPAVDPATGKVEVKIQSESDSLQNGDVVGLSITTETVTDDRMTGPIIVPITALKVETDRTVVFTVSDDSTLVAHEITEGPILGSSIVIAEGVTRGMAIVTDARGLNEGDHVTVLN